MRCPGDPQAPIGSIHPRGKQIVGARLAASYLNKVLGYNIDFAGPRYLSGENGGIYTCLRRSIDFVH